MRTVILFYLVSWGMFLERTQRTRLGKTDSFSISPRYILVVGLTYSDLCEGDLKEKGKFSSC